MREAISNIRNNSTLGIGGSLIRRHPIAAIHEIIRQRKKNLTIYGWNNANDFDLLIAAGCVREAHSSYVGMANVGQAYSFRRALEKGIIRFIDHSETTAIDRFRAGASGVNFLPSKSLLNSSLYVENEYTKPMKCPFTGEEYVALKAFQPDVAIIHAHKADVYGNVQLDRKRMMDNETDILIAKSAKFTIVTVEQIVSEDAICSSPTDTVLPKLFIDAVVEAPYGAYPTSCDTRYDYDLDHLLLYNERSKTEEGISSYLEEYIYQVRDWEHFLEKVGIDSLISLTRTQGVHQS